MVEVQKDTFPQNVDVTNPEAWLKGYNVSTGLSGNVPGNFLKYEQGTLLCLSAGTIYSCKSNVFRMLRIGMVLLMWCSILTQAMSQ